MTSQIIFVPIQQTSHTEAFKLYKSALHDVIEKNFGWDDEFQKNRFKTKYQLSWFYWIEFNKQRIGIICFYENPSDIHISLLIIDDAFQNLSFGKMSMDLIHQKARTSSKKISLSSFKNNLKAIHFYKKLGYQITNQDQYFYDLELERP